MEMRRLMASDYANIRGFNYQPSNSVVLSFRSQRCPAII